MLKNQIPMAVQLCSRYRLFHTSPPHFITHSFFFSRSMTCDGFSAQTSRLAEDLSRFHSRRRSCMPPQRLDSGLAVALRPMKPPSIMIRRTTSFELRSGWRFLAMQRVGQSAFERAEELARRPLARAFVSAQPSHWCSRCATTPPGTARSPAAACRTNRAAAARCGSRS